MFCKCGKHMELVKTDGLGGYGVFEEHYACECGIEYEWITGAGRWLFKDKDYEIDMDCDCKLVNINKSFKIKDKFTLNCYNCNKTLLNHEDKSKIVVHIEKEKLELKNDYTNYKNNDPLKIF